MKRYRFYTIEARRVDIFRYFVFGWDSEPEHEALKKQDCSQNIVTTFRTKKAAVRRFPSATYVTRGEKVVMRERHPAAKLGGQSPKTELARNHAASAPDSSWRSCPRCGGTVFQWAWVIPTVYRCLHCNLRVLDRGWKAIWPELPP